MKDLINRIKILKDNPNNNLYLEEPLIQTTKSLEKIIELLQANVNYGNYNDRCKKGCNFVSNFDTHLSCTIGESNCPSLIKIKEAIGDTFITLVMLSIQIKIDANDIYKKCEFAEVVGWNDTKNYNILRSTNSLFNSISEINFYLFSYDEKRHTIREIAEMIELLNFIANLYDLKLKECIEQSYKNIKEK